MLTLCRQKSADHSYLKSSCDDNHRHKLRFAQFFDELTYTCLQLVKAIFGDRDDLRTFDNFGGLYYLKPKWQSKIA